MSGAAHAGGQIDRLVAHRALGDGGHYLAPALPAAVYGPGEGSQVVEFLQTLQRTLRGPLLAIWDRPPAHRLRLVHGFVESQHGSARLERLPAYAPELEPVQYIWSYLRRHEVVHFRAQDFAELTTLARARLASMQRRWKRVAAFWRQAEPAT